MATDNKQTGDTANTVRDGKSTQIFRTFILWSTYTTSIESRDSRTRTAISLLLGMRPFLRKKVPMA